jgi:predicted transcriptional regulator
MKVDIFEEIDLASGSEAVPSEANRPGTVSRASLQDGSTPASAEAWQAEASRLGRVQILNPTASEAQPLANRPQPHYYVQKEAPQHRVMLELSAQGYTVKEIADRTGFTPVCVNNILRQPHAQQTLVSEIRRMHGTDEEVVQVIKENVVKAVETLAAIVEDTRARNSDRINAANALLDRRYGKPNTPINRGTDVDLNRLSDAELVQMLAETANTGTNA